MSLRVNDLLHTLRGEQFRHSQNLRRSRSHLSSGSITAHIHNTPSLPVPLIYHQPQQQQQHNDHDELTDTDQSSTWCARTRAIALSIVFPHHPTSTLVPSLTVLCLQILSSAYPASEFATDIVPSLPPHLRRVLIRTNAVHAPLSSAKLYSLCEPHGHADGELVVVGPHATLPSDHFQRMHESLDDEELSWDSPAMQDETATTELHTVVILNCSITTSTLLTLPPTITHLALIDIPTAVSLHRLPGICPLIVVLDLSHNKWASPASKEVQYIFCRVPWSRWKRLRILGLRGCIIPRDILVQVNIGRWKDVEIIL